MNKIILLGRFTRDPEVRYTSTGKVVCQGTIAVDRPFVNQDGQHEADFIPIVTMLKMARNVMRLKLLLAISTLLKRKSAILIQIRMLLHLQLRKMIEVWKHSELPFPLMRNYRFEVTEYA
mgnify:CR=1 FL=1